jgi:hypothetical protein
MAAAALRPRFISGRSASPAPASGAAFAWRKRYSVFSDLILSAKPPV